MSALGHRGYQPRNVRFAAAVAPANAAAAEVHAPNQQAVAYLQIRNEAAANSIRVYWTEADFTADANFFTLLALSEYEGPAEARQFWLRAVGGAVEGVSIWYHRRG